MIAALQPSVQRWLQDHCESAVQVQGGLVIAAGVGQQLAQTVAQWPLDGGMNAALAAVAQAAWERARPVVVVPSVAADAAGPNRLIALPLRSGDRKLGAAALAVSAPSGQEIDALFKALELACPNVAQALASAALGPVHDQARGLAATEATGGSLASADASPPISHAGQVLQLQHSFLRAPSLVDAALLLCSELAALLGCEHVALAVPRHTDLHLLALSNSADFKRQQDLLRLMTAAMQEAADQGARVLVPAPSTGAARLLLAHTELHQHTGLTVASVPMVHNRVLTGALLALWRSRAAPDAAQLALLDGVAAVIAPLLALRADAEMGLAQRLKTRWRTKSRSDYGTHAVMPTLLTAAALATGVAAVVAAIWVPLDYRLGANARIEGAVQRVVAAPMDGFLSKSHVRPGDTVKAGTVLVEMAEQDLVLEQRKWEAALAQHENGIAAALARADRAQFVISQGKASEASAQLELVRQQLARTKLVAPIDGVVIKGDLSQNLGAPVQKGDALLTVAPAEQFRLIVEVDERDVAQVQPGQKGQLALAASPAEPLAFVVERVTPVSVLREGRNVFEVQARLNAAAPLLRPGLQGVAKIEAGQASAAWIWGRHAWQWLRLTLWSWGP
jgi:multidrug resistance efflux pump